MQIGVVARTVGLSVDAIRFYERNGLLARPPRTEGGFRRYAENDLETLAFIRRVQGLGFKLSEIRGLLRLRGNRLQPCAPSEAALAAKTCRRADEASRSSEIGTRAAFDSAQLQQRTAKDGCTLPGVETAKAAASGAQKVKVEVLYVSECPS